MPLLKKNKEKKKNSFHKCQMQAQVKVKNTEQEV